MKSLKICIYIFAVVTLLCSQVGAQKPSQKANENKKTPGIN